jgi:DinB family protein
MKVHEPINFSINMTSQIVNQTLEDLTDKEMLHRPHPECNHINWQLGHLIVAEHGLIEKELPGAMPPLPAGFAEKYAMDKTKVDDPKALASKEELLRVYHEQRAGLIKAFEKSSEADLGRKTEGWTPNVGSLFLAAASSHWLMHVGQWSVIRRQLGRKPLF